MGEGLRRRGAAKVASLSSVLDVEVIMVGRGGVG